MAATPNARTEQPALETRPYLAAYDPSWVAGFPPTIYVDVSDVAEAKLAVLEAYPSLLEWRQMHDAVDLLAAARTLGAYRGLQAQVAMAEAFAFDASDGRGAHRTCAAVAAATSGGVRRRQAGRSLALGARDGLTRCDRAWGTPPRPRNSPSGIGGHRTPTPSLSVAGQEGRRTALPGRLGRAQGRALPQADGAVGRSPQPSPLQGEGAWTPSAPAASDWLRAELSFRERGASDRTPALARRRTRWACQCALGRSAAHAIPRRPSE